MQDAAYKRCSRCRHAKPLGGFYLNARGRPDSWCKACKMALDRARYWGDRPRPVVVEPPPVESLDPGFGHWLAGFVDGEGSFVIVPHTTQHGRRWRMQFAVQLRDDDLALLERCRNVTGIGVVNRRPARTTYVNGNPAAAWVVNSRRDAEQLVRLFDVYPLRSKKALDYAIWREAIAVWAHVRPGRADGRNDQYWAEIAALRVRLNEGRAYRPQE